MVFSCWLPSLITCHSSIVTFLLLSLSSAAAAPVPADALAFPAIAEPTPLLFFPHTLVDSELWH